jgi:hypothetical protein
MRAEIQPPGSKAPAPLFRDEGVAVLLFTGGQAIRGIKAMNGVLFAVWGTTLYSVDSAGSFTFYGTIAGSGRVSMAHNGTQLVIVNSSGTGYVWNGTTLSTITDPDFKPAAWVEFFDQYMVFGWLDGSGFGISALADATSFDALDVATPEAQPDSLIAGIRDHRDLILFGTDSVELWYNSGLADFPFERAPGGVLEVGCAARYSPAVIDNTTYWLAREKGGVSVRRLVGNTPQRVSTPAMDDLFDSMTEAQIAAAIGMAWSYGGHAYYALTVGGKTFRYDASTQLWTQKISPNRADWRVTHVEACYGRTLVGTDAGIGYFDRINQQELNQSLTWETVTPPVTQAGKVVTFNAFEVEIDAGYGPASGGGAEPTLALAWSDDDGRTWSNSYSRGMGFAGAYKTRCRWTNLGSSRNRCFRLTGSAAVKTALIRAYADVEIGP